MKKNFKKCINKPTKYIKSNVHAWMTWLSNYRYKTMNLKKHGVQQGLQIKTRRRTPWICCRPSGWFGLLSCNVLVNDKSKQVQYEWCIGYIMHARREMHHSTVGRNMQQRNWPAGRRGHGCGVLISRVQVMYAPLQQMDKRRSTGSPTDPTHPVRPYTAPDTTYGIDSRWIGAPPASAGPSAIYVLLTRVTTRVLV